MKNLNFIWRVVLVSILIGGLSAQLFGQDLILDEIIIRAERYKYLNAVSPEEAAQPVNILEHYAAEYDVRDADYYYQDEHKHYLVSFYIPKGKILAVYDNDNILLRTAERYTDTELPKHVIMAVAKRFPNWAITENTYLVRYYHGKEEAIKKEFKLVLENGNKRMKVKINDKAEFL